MNLTQLPAKLEEAVSSVLVDITPEMKNSFSNILKDLFCLTMEMPGKLNYTQLERMGDHTEKTWRTAFSKNVDWTSINRDAIFKVFSPSDHLSIVVDPAFIQKSGRCTPCTGLYWSGGTGAMKHGMEINAIGVTDVEKHDCMILTAPLTPSPELLAEQDINLRKWYLMTIASCRDTLLNISIRVTADAFFATRDFCDGLHNLGFSLISRFRDSTCLRYLHKPDPSEAPHKGRPQKFKDNFQTRKYRAPGFTVNLSFSALNMAKLVIHKENLALSIEQFHLIMVLVATATRINSRYAEHPTSKLMAG